MRYFYVLLSFTHLFAGCMLSCSPFRDDNSIRTTQDFDDLTETNDFDEANIGSDCITEECECLTCNNTLSKPKKTINPYKEQLTNHVPPKPFGTFCVKCVACLAVAIQIQKVIENASHECETDVQKKNILLQEIEGKVRDLCDNGFKNFDLRSYGNHGILTDKFRCTKHIVSTMDGNWTKKLREICSLYISRVNIETMALNVVDSIGNLTDTFCRGTGIFRDCTNIKSHENIAMPPCGDYEC